MNTRSLIFTIPLILFLLLAVLFFVGLGGDPRKLPSPLIDQPAPSFSLNRLGSEEQVNPVETFKGKPWILNVWASWCVACRVEHPVFNALRRNHNNVVLIGLNYQDDPVKAQQWLDELGDPYTLSVEDADGRVGIDWGVYAVPETFVIDAQGSIRYKHIGPVSQQLMDETLLPILTDLGQS